MKLSTTITRQGEVRTVKNLRPLITLLNSTPVIRYTLTDDSSDGGRYHVEFDGDVQADGNFASWSVMAKFFGKRLPGS